ncbi:hypothetical protein ACB092_11G217700 [Castanea dentata]
MSKTLLSRIKPLHNPKPVSSSSPLPFRNFIKHVQGTIQILKTQDQWEQPLESFFSESDVVVSDFAHFILDRIHDVELGVFSLEEHLASKRPYSCSLNGSAYSSFLTLLARFKVFLNIELVLERMKLEELKPTCEALSVVIQAYADSGLVDKAVELYYVVGEIHNCVPSHQRIETARQVYDKMLKNSCVDNYSTCIMVRGLCKDGKVEEGRELIEDRWGEGCIPNVVFYNTLIDGYCNKGEFEEFLPTLETYGVMINGFCKKGDFEAIDRLLLEMKERGLKVNARHGCTVKVVEIMGRMIESGCELDIITYNTLINVSCKRGRGLMLNKFSYTPLIHVYCRQGKYYRALDLLIKMTEGGHKPDLVSYGTLIHGLIVTGEVDVALAMREKMLEKGVLPDVHIYDVLISGLCKKGRFPTAKLLFANMLDQNVQPNVFVYATLVDGFIRNGDIQEAKKLSKLVIEKGFCKFGMMKDAFSSIIRMRKGHHVPDVFTYTILIDGYAKQHDLDGALKMFGLMVKQRCKPNVVTYIALINGFCGKANTNRAENFFREMQSCGLEPNVVTYTILIGRFCKDCKLAKAASFFELMLMSKCTPNDVIFHYLVNGFAIALTTVLKESNELQEVEKSMFLDFFGRMVLDGWVQVTAAYNSIIICLCQYGMVKIALQLCDKMIGKGFLLDSVSFSALLHGICLEGRSKEWKNIVSCTLNMSSKLLSNTH